MLKRPNILFFMCDQMRAHALNDSRCIKPNLEELAKNGMTFINAYTVNAVCSPARASLMTGLLPHNHGVMWVTHVIDADHGNLREDRPHWAQLLEKCGYKTGYFGKWHVERSENLQRFGWQTVVTDSSPEFRRRRAEGRQEAGEFLLAGYNDNPEGYDTNRVLYAVTELDPSKRGVGITTDFALEYLDKVLKGDDPWCCFVGVSEPHDPYICGRKAFEMYDVDSMELPPNVSDDLTDKPNLYKKLGRVWKNMTERQKKEAMACYYACITEIDGQFGRLVEKIRKAGKLEDTIIVFTSDHGELLGSHGMYCKNIGAFEEIYNIPLVIAGPGIAKGCVSQARVGLHDLCQTILELTGNETFNVPDSRSFAPVLSDLSREKDYRTGFAEYFGGRILLTQRIVWDGEWKYVFNGFDYDELYNLERDPYEMHNLIDNPEYDAVLRRMSSLLWKYVKETGDSSLYNSDYPALRVASYGPAVTQAE